MIALLQIKTKHDLIIHINFGYLWQDKAGFKIEMVAVYIYKILLKILAFGVAICLLTQVQAQETDLDMPADMPAPLPSPTSSSPTISPPAVTQEFVPQERNQPAAQPQPAQQPQPAAQILPPETGTAIEAEPSPLPTPSPATPSPAITPPVLSEPSLPAPLPTPSLSPTPSLAMNSNLPQDISPYGMFMQADIIVQSVMVGLMSASALTWVIWLAKSVEIAMAKKRVRRAVKTLISSRSLGEAIEKFQDRKGVSARLIMAAAGEVRLSLGAVDGAGAEGMKERIASHLTRIEVRSHRIISRGTGILASIGSVAPFVGLFGTVWGIMNAFIGISHAQTTNLAVVAPGIAEALLATAMGLLAAIPAVVIYNVFARSITVYRQMLADISAAIERLVSRDLDFRLAHKKAAQPTVEAKGA